MTYAVGLRLSQGLVFMSDTRTNAGVDNISKFKKMFSWNVPGDRTITLLTAGNLATTQAVVSLLEERTKAPEDRAPSILEAPTMFQVARIVSAALKEVIEGHARGGQQADSAFHATLILGGQIEGGQSRLFLIYPEGNFIEAGAETPFFQIGETKYGRPILVRAFDADMSFAEAVKLLLVSFDSTIKANLGVGLPLDLQLYTEDSLTSGRIERVEADDPYFKQISEGWGDALKSALEQLPDFEG
ncbi:proteasome endopeptidase complex, archaeal, beta subunit [Tritonibacter multivorans]|uniref:Proteasome endopeptidase complex, archaeal, beta subunit n=1 Tax=Tritonibacter multivorans TaxID=928856 RepID=A0A0P1GTM7_9RHOB|nr:proteasome-type protease [Tritonibacter multivorans]MDA7422089.1 proteasome-type protease [Tritonibacter multivorans]CUH78490.1 proteasome endopeptidase complex, archaeal, beta subunit [Tritonibacter multivorans]SFD17589.1 putative proteasome-type protease [Tritonibacter multivorans]